MRSKKEWAKLMCMAGMVALIGGMLPAAAALAQDAEVAEDGTPINVQPLILDAADTLEPATVVGTVEYGNPPDVNNGNCFPFGCTSGTRYQQVYDSSFFSEPVLIDQIEFFATYYPGNFATADYEIRLSTTAKAVNGLETATLSNNVGADDTFFYSATLSGPTGSVITFDGVDFPYDPSMGNLLIDIKVTNRQGSGSTYLDACNGSFGTDSSRAHDFGSSFSSYGLRTRFYTAPLSIKVAIDIKPGSDDNSINLCSNGAVPVAILGSNTFDVYDINPDTLRLADAAVKVVGKKDKSLCSVEDVNGDYYDDLVCHFNTTELGDMLDGTLTSATVKGETVEGTPIEGSDNIIIVKDECE